MLIVLFYWINGFLEKGTYFCIFYDINCVFTSQSHIIKGNRTSLKGINIRDPWMIRYYASSFFHSFFVHTYYATHTVLLSPFCVQCTGCPVRKAEALRGERRAETSQVLNVAPLPPPPPPTGND